MTNPITTFMVTLAAHGLLRLLIVLVALLACAWIVSRLARLTPWLQCISLLLASVFFLDSDAQQLAVIVLVAYKVVVPLAWWSFRQFVQEGWVVFRNWAPELCHLLVGLSLGLLCMIQNDRADAPPGLQLVLAVLFLCWFWKQVVARVPRALRMWWNEVCWYTTIVAGMSCAVVLGCAAPMVTDSVPMAAVHLVLDALYVRWLRRQMSGYLQDRLRVWLYTIARVAAAVVALCLAVPLYVWFTTVPKEGAASLWTFAVVGQLLWVCAPFVGRRLVRILQGVARMVIVGHGVVLAVRDARQQEAMGAHLTAVRRSPRLVAKPRVNYLI